MRRLAFTRFEAQEYQDIHFPKTKSSNGLDREEITSPQHILVTGQKLFPTVGGSIRSGFDPLFLEDVLHRLAANPFDSQFSDLANNSGVPKARGLGDLDHEFSDLLGLPLTTFGVLGSLLFPIPNPTIERTDDGDQ